MNHNSAFARIAGSPAFRIRNETDAEGPTYTTQRFFSIFPLLGAPTTPFPFFLPPAPINKRESGCRLPARPSRLENLSNLITLGCGHLPPGSAFLSIAAPVTGVFGGLLPHSPPPRPPVFRAYLAPRRYREVRSRSSCSPKHMCGDSVYSVALNTNLQRLTAPISAQGSPLKTFFRLHAQKHDVRKEIWDSLQQIVISEGQLPRRVAR